MSAKKTAWIAMKQWCYEEAIKEGLHPTSIWYRLYHGYYPNVQLRKVNLRVVFVLRKEEKS